MVGNITDKDEFEKGIREREASSSTAVGDVKYRILAVTACPTGIAHTYMAAEAL